MKFFQGKTGSQMVVRPQPLLNIVDMIEAALNIPSIDGPLVVVDIWSSMEAVIVHGILLVLLSTLLEWNL